MTAFDIGRTRRRYAHEKLDVNTIGNMDDLPGSLVGAFDCFFSAHVLEHVPSPRQVFAYAIQLLKVNGVFVSFTPNGCQEHRNSSDDWSKAWGEVHPNYIDVRFLDKNFRLSPRCAGASPVANAFLPEEAHLETLNSLESCELFFAARKTETSWS